MEDNKNIDTTKTEGTKVDEPKTNVDAAEKNTLTMTQEELDKIISKRLDRERKKAEEEKAEAEKLAKMSEEERLKAEFNKEKAKFEEERKQYLMEKLELQVTKELASKELPTEFSKYLIGDDAEACMKNIKEFESAWQKAIEKAVDSKLKGSTPKTGGSVTSTISKEDFSKMGYMERVKLSRENPELYKQLIKK